MVEEHIKLSNFSKGKKLTFVIKIKIEFKPFLELGNIHLTGNEKTVRSLIDYISIMTVNLVAVTANEGSRFNLGDFTYHKNQLQSKK